MVEKLRDYYYRHFNRTIVTKDGYKVNNIFPCFDYNVIENSKIFETKIILYDKQNKKYFITNLRKEYLGDIPLEDCYKSFLKEVEYVQLYFITYSTDFLEKHSLIREIENPHPELELQK